MCKQSIIVVDDNMQNIKIAMSILSDLDCELIYATNGKQALERIRANKPDLILLDIMMPELDGIETCQVLKTDKDLSKIPIIFLTAKSDQEDIIKGFEVGALDYILKPFNSEELIARVKTHLKLYSYEKSLERQIRLRTIEIKTLQSLIIQAMGTMAEYRDNETGGHISRTQHYVKELAICMKTTYSEKYPILTDEYIDLLFESAPLHDVGKVAIRDNILLKPAKLEDHEFEQMKKHTQYGYDVISDIEKKMGESSFLTIAKEVAGYHHEKWDGSGYHEGLKGEEIPLSARIMAVADVYDALISKRVYKDSMSHQQAMGIIEGGSGNHFDPTIVECFLKIEETIKEIAEKFKDD